jgi:hypothetical protein
MRRMGHLARFGTMKLQAAFLAEHVGNYGNTLNVLGGVIGQIYAIRGVPFTHAGLNLVVLLDLADEPFTIEEDAPRVNLSVRMTSPDGRQTNPLARDAGQLHLKSGHQSFAWWPLMLEIQQAGAHGISVSSDDGQAVSVRLVVSDMSPDG